MLLWRTVLVDKPKKKWWKDLNDWLLPTKIALFLQQKQNVQNCFKITGIGCMSRFAFLYDYAVEIQIWLMFVLQV